MRVNRTDMLEGDGRTPKCLMAYGLANTWSELSVMYDLHSQLESLIFTNSMRRCSPSMTLDLSKMKLVSALQEQEEKKNVLLWESESEYDE